MEHEIFDEMVLFHAEPQVIVSLNGSAREIWELCDGQRSVPEICQELCCRLGVSDNDVFSSLLADVEVAVNRFQQYGLVVLDETLKAGPEDAT